MSLTQPQDQGASRSFTEGPKTGPAPKNAGKITIPLLQQMKRAHTPIAALTAYDYVTGRIADEAGIDLALVGDSLAMVVLGHENTLSVTMEEMLVFTRATRRGVRHALLAADMPFGSYHASIREGVANAVRFLKEAGAEAVKIEGPRVGLVRALVDAEVPVIGHIGLTPQSVHSMGGYRVQGKSAQEADRLMNDAAALEAAGVSLLVLEGVPREVSARITMALSIPSIGIGAGPECDGQILVFHDLLGLTFVPEAKFVRQYADLAMQMTGAIADYRKDVRSRAFPRDTESYHMPKETRETWGRTMGGPRSKRP